ncbi:glycosyl hydrolase family 28-related protein [Rhodocista pekingensis]|uniref:Glycosyl hydrolase family 28-related protein n=1 Tax=Rhodocista pekingensis TaxID=201185 RepID=A0ABW2KT26_9PROT
MTEHIPVPAVSPRVQYRADGQTTRFVFAFPIFAAGDLKVFLDAAPQDQGYALAGIGAAGGGAVTFALPPADGVLVTLERRLAVERLTDFQESGPLAARSLNEQFDRLTAQIQQLAADQERMLRYAGTDLPAGALLPDRRVRAGRVLGFDAEGNPVALDPAGLPAPLPAAVQAGAGAVARSLPDKLRDSVSAKDYGAVGDGIADDTAAIRAALAAHRAVHLPAGAYRISGTLTLRYGQTLSGVGEGSVIQARAEPFDAAALPGYDSPFNAVEIVEGYAALRDLRIVGGATGIKLYGRDGPCVKNVVENVSVWDTLIGIVLDGHADADRPCYWNHVARVLCARQQLHGVLLTVESTGDTPNANKFHDVRVYSLGAPIQGCGFFLSAARFNNSFVDCEANLHPSGEACFRLGAATDQTLIVNFYAESLGALPGVRIDNGSRDTSIVNLFSATAGQPIWDPAETRAFTAVNAGHPTRNYLKKTWITDLRLEGLQLDTDYVEPATGGLVEPDLRSTTYLVSAFGGPVEFRLPAADPANGRVVTVKKTDASPNPVRITEDGGPGPDNREVVLANRYDVATLVSNGATWWLTGSNLLPENAWFHDEPGLYRPDTTRRLHLVGTAGGAVEVRLPAPGDPQAAGRWLTVKKSDDGSAPVTVTTDGGGGPEGRPWLLGRRYDHVTVFSNGAEWLVTGAARPRAAVRFHEAAGLLEADLGADIYLVSAFAGPVEVRLPAPAAAHAGAVVSVKKTDPGPNPVSVTAAGDGSGGSGPDGAAQTLAAQHAALTAVCNGAAWHLLSRHPA